MTYQWLRPLRECPTLPGLKKKCRKNLIILEPADSNHFVDDVFFGFLIKSRVCHLTYIDKPNGFTTVLSIVLNGSLSLMNMMDKPGLIIL